MKKPAIKNSVRGFSRGFTLTELLVVIVIIVVLAALAMLGSRRVRGMADKATSIRNLNQLQLANMSYASDNSGNCVPIRANSDQGNATRWFQDLEYLTNLTGIPAEQLKRLNPNTIPLKMLDPKVVRARKDLYSRVYCSYGMNDTGLKLGGEPNLNSRHNINQILDPGRTMAFATATDFRVTYNSRFKWDFENPNDSKTAAGDIAYRHRNKVLVVYFDGHAGEMSKADIQDIDKRGGKSNPFWNPKAR